MLSLVGKTSTFIDFSINANQEVVSNILKAKVLSLDGFYSCNAVSLEFFFDEFLNIISKSIIKLTTLLQNLPPVCPTMILLIGVCSFDIFFDLGGSASQSSRVM